jgi:hypothetical protein
MLWTVRGRILVKTTKTVKNNTRCCLLGSFCVFHFQTIGDCVKGRRCQHSSQASLGQSCSCSGDLTLWSLHSPRIKMLTWRRECSFVSRPIDECLELPPGACLQTEWSGNRHGCRVEVIVWERVMMTDDDDVGVYRQSYWTVMQLLRTAAVTTV